jgi:hypothetical protein
MVLVLYMCLQAPDIARLAISEEGTLESQEALELAVLLAVGALPKGHKDIDMVGMDTHCVLIQLQAKPNIKV